MITHNIEQLADAKQGMLSQEMPNEGEVASPIEAMPSIVFPPDSKNFKPTRILVVDDELAGFVFVHVRESEPTIEGVFGDSTSPEVSELFDLFSKKIGVPKYERDTDAFCNYLMSNNFVTQMLTADWFRAEASPKLRDNFANFFARTERASALRHVFEQAFPQPDFEIAFEPSWLSEPETLTYDFIFLDLVLIGSATPVDDLKKFLSNLSTFAGNQRIPPITVMSTAGDELKDHRKEFSKASQISAAGLWILPKSDLESADFKARGLRVLFDQLIVQRSAAHRIRCFIQFWVKALQNAASEAESTLWNLDASAVQRIHFTAIGDNDPFDGHFGDLISREYLWNVERDKGVSNALVELDKCLREHLDGSERMRTRFMSPIVDPQVARNFFSHYVWAGWPTAGPFYGTEVENPEQKFNATLPFGSVLASDLKEGVECLIHVTQQCDLNAATRPDPKQRSAVFAIAEARATLPHFLPSFDSDAFVAVGLKTPDGEFDLKFVPGLVLAMPIPDFLKLAEERKLSVVGRLRFDVANQFAQATANQLTRPAAFKMAREANLPVKVFLLGEIIPQKPPTVYEQSPGKGREVTVGRTTDGFISFPDDDGLRIAVWIERMLIKHCGGSELDVVQLANKLRLGIRIDEEFLPNLRLDLRHGELNKAFKTINGLQAPKSPGIKLVLVGDEASKEP